MEINYTERQILIAALKLALGQITEEEFSQEFSPSSTYDYKSYFYIHLKYQSYYEITSV